MGRRWTEDGIRRELEAFLPGFEVWPSYPVFRRSGRRGLWQAIAKRGGPERFAEEYGLAYGRNARGLGEAEIRARLRAALRGSSLAVWPSKAWLTRHAGSEVVTAIERTGGAERWANALGLPVQRPRWQRTPPRERRHPAPSVGDAAGSLGPSSSMIVGRRLPGGDTTASIDDVARLIEERLCELDAQLAAFEELARERDRLRRALRELRAEPDTASDGRSPRAASSSRAATRRRGGTRGAERGSTLAAISDYVRDHPGANAAEIARATGIDRALITSAAPRPANDGRLRRVPKSRRQIGYELAGESADRGA